MPKMNGFELYKKMKTIDNKIRVCFLTALTDLHEYDVFKKEVHPKEGKDTLFESQLEMMRCWKE
jgi:two-component SAPR family response regulator